MSDLNVYCSATNADEHCSIVFYLTPVFNYEKSGSVFLLTGLSITGLSSETTSRENNGSLISIVFSSVYIMRSSRSGCILWIRSLLFFDTCLFHRSVRPPGSLGTISTFLIKFLTLELCN